MDFRVDLEIFRGPLDLLLYLVRKHEVDVVDIPIAPITEQFLEYLAILKEIDVNSAGDFLEVASTLVEAKSRMVLPRGGEVEDALDDPRQQLVERLLEYKKFKDAASMLEERSQSWQRHYPRLSADTPRERRELSEEPIHEVEVWDLVSAFGKLMRQADLAPGASIVYDETPIHVYMGRIKERLVERGRLSFHDFFQPGMPKSAVVGIFLAILELVRHRQARAEQEQLFGDITLVPGQSAGEDLDVSGVETYEHQNNDESG
jgi:segregation and condensation protein A